MKDFFKHEATGGVLLLAVTVIALLLANSPHVDLYTALLHIPIQIRVSEFNLEKPMWLWINDGLMAVFFLQIGLEIKREVLVGGLSHIKTAILPIIAAIGGIAIPAAIYVALNHHDKVALTGWAIPTATDIAFSLGLLTLFGKRIPPALKVFLLALAIMDDLVAILIIAIFYTSNLSMLVLSIAILVSLFLFFLNYKGVTTIAVYMVVGVILWVLVLKSGVHAILAGVITALAIPLKTEQGASPLYNLERSLHPWAILFILPLFAFANAGVSFRGLGFADFFHPLPLGIALGLIVGKFVGVFGFSLSAIKLRIAKLPQAVTLPQLAGVAALCGIGFTMSLFIGGLAYDQTRGGFSMTYRIGILVGSLVSAIIGMTILKYATRNNSHPG